MQIMNKYHPRWNEFLISLKYILDRLPCDNTHSYVEFILKTMSNIDIEGTLNYFNNQGFTCGCLILLNKEK